MKHTPGPWTLGMRGEHGYDDIRITDSDGIMVADVVSSSNSDRVAANARLIAAAPELLEALKSASIVVRDVAKQHGDQPQGQAYRDLCQQIEAAIEKAGA